MTGTVSQSQLRSEWHTYNLSNAQFSTMTILLLGKDGQVGWQLQRSLAPHGRVLALGRAECDCQILITFVPWFVKLSQL
jgi:hypothetical protein